MTDSDDDVRLVATNTFASLIKLVPLEVRPVYFLCTFVDLPLSLILQSGLPDPPGFSEDMLAKRDEERRFLTQLLDGSKIEPYELPIPIKAELRKYQREGVSWLAFLAKYQLHGILCDGPYIPGSFAKGALICFGLVDMGLGKTLQSICILASKTHERRERYKATKSPDAVHLPSLVLCPPTLTGHWAHEIKTYTDALKPLVYMGDKAERARLVKAFKKHDVVITSYEVARNDIEQISRVDWNYCILDEGHVIKNGKTKLTKALKTIRANHRLILSGTPIQNNVLELWSLFDFLMPGFLGSEKAFNDRFSKPILSSRDAKSSSKEQSAGALALEALHKQVLPFLLRRMKEDVLDDLPPKIIQDYSCELSPMQKLLYEEFSRSEGQGEVASELGKADVDGEGESTKEGGTHVFQALQYLRKLVNHPALVIKPDLPQHQEIIKRFTPKDGGSPWRDISHAPKLSALK
jgi:TATA-binding protein-associated factor